jgi:transposase InsO family protein
MKPEQREKERQQAIQRSLMGQSPSAICASMGYSRDWFYKWLRRFEAGDPDWFRNRSRRPHRNPARTSREIKEEVITVRRQLVEQGLFHGDQAIRWELEDKGVEPLPSLRTIGRILVREGLTRRAKGRYEPKGKKYPAPIARQPGEVHQTDFVGPRYLRGPIRFYSLNSVDLGTGRCAIEPLIQRGGQRTVDAVWASWCRLGMPRHQQVDNDMGFYGSPSHPRGMGSLIRLCLNHDIEAWFIPIGEPWRNGVVEKFNDHWREKFVRRIEMDSTEKLFRESLRFEERHNARYRYSKLGGKTPQAALEASGVRLRFPPTAEAPRYPLPKPERGCYHVVRFVRSDGLLDVFGEKFHAPPEAIYEYVCLTIDVDTQRLLVYLDGQIVDEHDYHLR